MLETLQPLSGDRKAFRLINGVLMEQTVKDVLPALKTNSEGLKMVLDDLVKQYKAKQDELEKWKVSITPSLFSVEMTCRSCIQCRKRTIFRLFRHEYGQDRWGLRMLTTGCSYWWPSPPVGFYLKDPDSISSPGWK